MKLFFFPLLISLAYCMDSHSRKLCDQEPKWAKEETLNKHLWELLTLPEMSLDRPLLAEYGAMNKLAVQTKLLTSIFPWHGKAGERVIQLALEAGFIVDRFQFSLDLCVQEKFCLLQHFLNHAQLDKDHLDAVVCRVVASMATLEKRKGALATLTRLGASSSSVDSVMASLYDLEPQELPPMNPDLPGNYDCYRDNIHVVRGVEDILEEQIIVFLSNCADAVRLRSISEGLFQLFPHHHAVIVKHGFRPYGHLLENVVRSGNLKAALALVSYSESITAPANLYSCIPDTASIESSLGICEVLYQSFHLELGLLDKIWAFKHEQCFRYLLDAGAFQFDPQVQADQQLFLSCLSSGSVNSHERLDLLLSSSSSELGPWFLLNSSKRSSVDEPRMRYAARRGLINTLRCPSGLPIGILMVNSEFAHLAKVYFSCGGDPNVQSLSKRVPLDLFYGFKNEKENEEIIELFMDHGAHPITSQRYVVERTAKKIVSRRAYLLLIYGDGVLAQLLPDIRHLIMNMLLWWFRR